MPKIQLTATVVAHAQCPEGRSKVDFYDVAITGFILEVRSSGGKTYHLRYRDRHGRLRQHKIGDANDLPFDKARKAAEKLRSQVVLGEDPAEQRQAVKSVPTLEAFARERYLPYVKEYKRRWDSDEALLRLHLLPKFGHRHLDDIRHEDVVDLHKAKRASGLSRPRGCRCSSRMTRGSAICRRSRPNGCSMCWSAARIRSSNTSCPC